MRQIAKAIAATLTALGTWGATAALDGSIDGVEWFGLCGVATTGLLTWAVPNARARRG